MAAPSTGVTWVNSGPAVLVRDYAGSATDLSPGGTFGSPSALDGQIRKKNADAPVPPRRRRGIAGRARAGGGVMTNHPTSSSEFEEAARAGAAPPPPGPGTGHLLPTASPRLKQHGATPRCSPSESSAPKTLRYRSASTNSRSRAPSSTPTTTNCAANSLQSASSGTHSARRR